MKKVIAMFALILTVVIVNAQSFVPNTTFGGDGIVTGTNPNPENIVVNSTGDVFISGITYLVNPEKLMIKKIDSTGIDVNSINIMDCDNSLKLYLSIANDVIYAAYNTASEIKVIKFNANLDSIGGFSITTPFKVSVIKIKGNDLYIAANNGDYVYKVFKMNLNGVLDLSFNGDGSFDNTGLSNYYHLKAVNDLFIDSYDNVLISGSATISDGVLTDPANAIQRINSTGVDNSFASSTNSIIYVSDAGFPNITQINDNYIFGLMGANGYLKSYDLSGNNLLYRSLSINITKFRLMNINDTLVVLANTSNTFEVIRFDENFIKVDSINVNLGSTALYLKDATYKSGKVYMFGGRTGNWGDYTIVSFKDSTYTEPTVSITESNSMFIKKSEVTIYPNPTTDYININSDSEISSVSLYDYNGRLITSSNLTKLDVSSYPTGMYIIHIVYADNAVYTSKILKK